MDSTAPEPSRPSRFKRTWMFTKRHRWKVVIALIAFFLATSVYAVTRPSEPEYVTAVALRGDLRRTVDVVGTVISEHDLKLQFAGSDIVAVVSVKEGDRVKAGQKLAGLRSGTLAAGVAGAGAGVQSAQAALQALEEGSRPEEIAIAEADVRNRQASLDVARKTKKTAEEQLESIRREAAVGMQGFIQTSDSTISQNVSISRTALSVVHGVFGLNEVSDAIIRARPIDYEIVRSNSLIAVSALESLPTASPGESDEQTTLERLTHAREAVDLTSDVLSRSYDILSNLPITSYLTLERRETHKATVAAQKTSVQGSLAALDSAIKALRDARAGFDTRLAAQQGALDRATSDIASFEAQLQAQQAQLALKRSPSRQTDIDAARARVRQAQADLARASAQLKDTMLFSPVDGVVTKVNVKQGELSPAGQPAIEVLGNSPYRIEMFVSEIDIPTVQLSQSGSIELDAFRGTHMKLTVNEIDPGSTDRDGVTKYRVKLDFLYPHPELKLGMTGDAIIETGRREDVVSIPLRAVYTNAEGKKLVRVLKDGVSIEERGVETGIEGEGSNVEVKGVEEGETVVVLVKQ